MTNKLNKARKLSAVCRGSTVRSRYIIETICEKGEL